MTRAQDASGEWSTVLVRYGEIGIKSASVRRRFENRLVANMESALVARGVEAQVTRVRGRLFVLARDVDAALDAVTHTFGVVSASPVTEVPVDVDEISRAVVEGARRRLREGQSFAVRARRAGNHAFTSVELARQAGSAVMTDPDVPSVTVDLTRPDVEFHVEVRDERAFVYTDVVPGPGGLPVGTQGRVAAVVEDARGALAAWLLMKRGCSTTLVMPADRADTADDLVARLAEWAPLLKGITLRVPAEVARDPAARRAFLLQAAAYHVKRARGHAVVTGDGLTGAVASSHLDDAARLPVFRPLTGYAGRALADLARTAGFPVPDEPVDAPALPDVDRDALDDAVRAALRESAPVEVRAA